MLAKQNKHSNIFEVDLDRDQEKVVNVQVKEFQQIVDPELGVGAGAAEEEADLSLSGHKAPMSSVVKDQQLELSALTDGGSVKRMECQESVPSNEINVSTFNYGQRCGPSQQLEQFTGIREEQSPSNSSLSCSKTSQADALKRILYHNDKGNTNQPMEYKQKHQKKNSYPLMKKNIIDYSVNRQHQMQYAGQFDQNLDYAEDKEGRRQSRVVTSSSANIYSSEKKNQVGAANFGRSQSHIQESHSQGGSGKEDLILNTSESANIKDKSQHKDRIRQTNNFWNEYFSLPKTEYRAYQEPSRNRSLISQTEIENYSHISKNEGQTFENQRVILQPESDLACGLAGLSNNLPALESQQKLNVFKQSRSVDKLQDALNKKSGNRDNFFCLQAFSEEQKKLLQMEDNMRKCLQTHSEDTRGFRSQRPLSTKQELPCLIENLKIKSLVHEERGDNAPNNSNNRVMPIRDLTAHYKTQPLIEPLGNSKYFAKKNKQIERANEFSQNDNDNELVNSKKYNTTDGVLEGREDSHGVIQHIVSPIQVDYLLKPHFGQSMKIERGLTFGHGGFNTPFYSTEQKTQLDLINQTNSIKYMCMGQPPISKLQNTRGSIMSSNNQMNGKKAMNQQEQSKKNEPLNEFKYRKSTNKDMSPLNISESNTPSAALQRSRLQKHGLNRLFGTINSLPDLHDKQSNSSRSAVHHHNCNHDLYYRHLNDNLSEHLLNDSHQLRQQKAAVDKENALLLQKTDHQNQEIEMLKEKIKAMQAEQAQLIKVLQSYDGGFGGNPSSQAERQFYEEQQHEHLVEICLLKQENCDLQQQLQVFKQRQSLVGEQLQQLNAENQKLNRKHMQELQQLQIQYKNQLKLQEIKFSQQVGRERTKLEIVRQQQQIQKMEFEKRVREVKCKSCVKRDAGGDQQACTRENQHVQNLEKQICELQDQIKEFVRDNKIKMPNVGNRQAHNMSRNLEFDDLKKHRFNQKLQCPKNSGASSQRRRQKKDKNYSSSREYLGLVQPSSDQQNELKSYEQVSKQSCEDNVKGTKQQQFESQGEQLYTSNEHGWTQSKPPVSSQRQYQSEYMKSNHHSPESITQKQELLKEYQEKKRILEELWHANQKISMLQIENNEYTLQNQQNLNQINDMQNEIHGLLQQLQVEEDSPLKNETKRQRSAEEQTETLHSPTKSSDTKDVPLTNLMNDNFSYDSSQKDQSKSRQRIHLNLVKDESSKRTEQFILINHDDSNVFSNNEPRKRSKKNSENNSSSMIKTDKSIPIVSLKLCDFAENLRQRKNHETLEMSYSKDHDGSKNVAGGSGQKFDQDHEDLIMVQQDYNTAQNKTLHLDDFESMSTKLRRQNSLDMILRNEPLNQRHFYSNNNNFCCLEAPEYAANGTDSQPSSRIISKSRSKVQSFHQRSQVINALYFKKALKETKKAAVGLNHCPNQTLNWMNIVDILSQIPEHEIEFMKKKLDLRMDFKKQFVQNMDLYLIEYQADLQKHCPILMKKLEMLRQQEIIYQQKLHLDNSEDGGYPADSQNMGSDNWAARYVHHMNPCRKQKKKEQHYAPLEQQDMSRITMSAVGMELDSEPCSGQLSRLGRQRGTTFIELRQSKESNILQNILNDQRAHLRSTQQLPTPSQNFECLHSTAAKMTDRIVERGHSVEFVDSLHNTTTGIHHQKLQFETPKFQHQRNFLNSTGVLQNYQSVGSNNQMHQVQKLFMNKEVRFPKNLHERQKSNGSVTFGRRFNLQRNSMSFGSTMPPDCKLAELLNNPFQGFESWK